MTYMDTASICHIDCTDHPSEHEDVAVEKYLQQTSVTGSCQQRKFWHDFDSAWQVFGE